MDWPIIVALVVSTSSFLALAVLQHREKANEQARRRRIQGFTNLAYRPETSPAKAPFRRLPPARLAQRWAAW